MANPLYADEFYNKAAEAEIGKTLVSKKANVCPFSLRLAWHASGTFDKNIDSGNNDDAAAAGGSDGATMRFAPEISDDANAGLPLMHDILKPVHEKFPDLSIADLWIMAGVQGIKMTGGPDIPVNYGRVDCDDASKCPPNGRLPDAALGAQHLRDVFYRMGFDDKGIVALSGAHTLGSCHKLRSGFEGPWTTNPLKFDNEYFQNLLNIKWKVKQWDGPTQYEDPTGKLMMLPTDIALIEDPAFKKWVVKFANDEQAFRTDFAAAVSKLFALGCPAHCQPAAKKKRDAASAKPDANKDFRDLAMHGNLDKMKELVAAGGVDVNGKEGHSGRTALHKASYFGHVHVVAYLVNDAKADVNVVDMDGDTPLHDAAMFGHFEVVKHLITAGADKGVKNKDGKTAHDRAVANGKQDVAALVTVPPTCTIS